MTSNKRGQAEKLMCIHANSKVVFTENLDPVRSFLRTICLRVDEKLNHREKHTRPYGGRLLYRSNLNSTGMPGPTVYLRLSRWNPSTHCPAIRGNHWLITGAEYRPCQSAPSFCAIALIVYWQNVAMKTSNGVRPLPETSRLTPSFFLTASLLVRWWITGQQMFQEVPHW